MTGRAPGGRGGNTKLDRSQTARRQAVLTARREADDRMLRNAERAQREKARKAAQRAAAAQRSNPRVAAMAAAQQRAREAFHVGDHRLTRDPPTGSATMAAAAVATAGGGEGSGPSSPEQEVPSSSMDSLSLGMQQLRLPPGGGLGGGGGVPALGLGGTAPGGKKGGKKGKAKGPLSLALPQKAEPAWQQWQEWKTGPVPKAKAAQAETDAQRVARPAWATTAPPPLLSMAPMAAIAKKLAEEVQSGGELADATEAAEPTPAAETPLELVTLLGEDGMGGDPELVYDCLAQVRAQCFSRAQRELVGHGVLRGVLGAMKAHLSTCESVQIVSCEVLALLAGCDEALEQRIFEVGAIEACLAACEAWPNSEDVLGTAFEAIGLICRSEEDSGEMNPYGDKAAWARKKAAVELGALEVISAGMLRMVRVGGARWVHDIGTATIGSLCKGRDENGHARRARARALLRQSISSGPRSTAGR